MAAPGVCKPNQAPSLNMASCTHDFHMFVFKPGGLSAVQSYLPSAALLDHICLTACLDLWFANL